jgi:hypothetical protein
MLEVIEVVGDTIEGLTRDGGSYGLYGEWGETDEVGLGVIEVADVTCGVIRPDGWYGADSNGLDIPVDGDLDMLEWVGDFIGSFLKDKEDVALGMVDLTGDTGGAGRGASYESK